MGHTPEPPWTPHKLMPNAKLIQPEPEHYVTAGPFDFPGNRVVAAVHHVDGCDAQDIARLIAAAPELLYALQRAMAVISQHHPEDATCCNRDIKLIQATIAKATGE